VVISAILQLSLNHNFSAQVSQSPHFCAVWQIPHVEEIKSGSFNPSLRFASPELAIVSDGAGCLYLLDTNLRDTGNIQPWQVQFSSKIFEEHRPFEVVHCFLNDTDCMQPKQLYILLQRVEQIGQVQAQIPLSTLDCDAKKTPFVTLLEHVALECRDGHWQVQRLRRLAMPHGFEYAAVLAPGMDLCVAAREPLGIVYDSVRSVAVAEEKESSAKSEPAYVWSETNDEVTVWLTLGKDAVKEDVRVEKTARSLTVSFRDQKRLGGPLGGAIVVDDSLWTLSDGKLELVLAKSQRDSIWTELIVGDTGGSKVLDAESAQQWYQRTAHLTAEEMVEAPTKNVLGQEGIELEECDAFPSDETYLMRVDGDTNVVSHKASLGSHQVLFSAAVSPAMAPTLCLRHDVDGLMWQPEDVRDGAAWTCHHTATFQALGYVQASKEQRKFTVCPPNMSYVVCCDIRRHVYVYRQPGHISGAVDLVHRPTRQRIGTVARQQVLSLETGEEFLGAIATDSMLLVLSSSSLFAVRVNND